MSWYREILNKLSHFAGRGRFDESIDEEVRMHLESRAEELIAEGMPRRDAMAQARREFGPTARAAEESREAWRWRWIEDLVYDLRHAARTLSRDRVFMVTAVLSLALGIGVNTTIFSLATELLFSEPSVRNPQSLYFVSVGGSGQVPIREYKFIRDAKVFEGLAGHNPMQEINWRSGELSIRLFYTRVTENYFDVAGVPVALGRGIAAGERDVTVISHGFWQARMNGDPGILGHSILLDGNAYTIVGVLPEVHRTLVGFGYTPDVYLPVVGESGSVGLIGRMAPGETKAATLARLTATASQMDRVYPDGHHKWADDVSITGMVGIERLNDRIMGNVAMFFGMMMAVVGLLLLIACANVAGLLLARASTRVQEFAIRMSIGAGRGRLIRQMLAESLLLTSLGTVAGLAINYALTQLLNSAKFPMPFPVQLAIQPNTRLLVYAALIAVVSALVAGLLPAIRSTRARTSALLKLDEHQVSGRRAALRNVLVTGQLAISVLVLIMAALSIRNLIQSATLDPGFDLKHTSWAQTRLVPENYPSSAKVAAMVVSTLDQVRALPGVSAATVATFVPLNDHFLSRTRLVFTDGSSDGVRVEHSWNAVAPDYFKTMSIDLISGREFSTLDREGTQPVAILNEAFAKKIFGASNAVGQRIILGVENRSVRTIVGVVRNSKYSTIGEKDRPAIYDAYLQSNLRPTVNFLVKTSAPPQSELKTLNAALLKVDASAAVEVKAMSNATGFALLPSRMGAALLGTIGSLGLVLASVGLYGVLAYSISRRTREIGLRVALGAQRGQVLRLVLSEGAWMLGIGLTLGVFLALFVTRPLAMFLVPGLRPSDPLTYVSVTGILLAVGFFASLVPALRALRIDPMVALRYE